MLTISRRGVSHSPSDRSEPVNCVDGISLAGEARNHWRIKKARDQRLLGKDGRGPTMGADHKRMDWQLFVKQIQTKIDILSLRAIKIQSDHAVVPSACRVNLAIQ